MKLTLPQQDIYFDQLLHANEPIYNIGAKIAIKGSLDKEILKKSYSALIRQNDAYRFTFSAVGETVTAKLADNPCSELGFIDFSKNQNPHQQALLFMNEEFVKPFDLNSESLLHIFTLVKVEEDFHYLFSVYHHIITDGWGTSLMFQRLVQNYNEIYELGNIQSEYPFSYIDFIKEDQEYQESGLYLDDKKYWSEKFSVLPENLFDKIDEAALVTKSKRKEIILKRELYNQLNQLAQSCNCSSFHIILASLYLYFGRKHQNNDFAIGLPVLNRGKSKYKKTVGLFMGVSPLRIKLDFEQTFENLVKEVKNQLRQDYRHQRFPLGKLINELHLFNEKERIFNITLSYEKQDYANHFIHTKTNVIPLTHESERAALAVYIREFDALEDVKIDFDYNLNYFNDFTINQVVSHFQNVITDILENPNKKLKEISYLTTQEEKQLLREFNDTKATYPTNKTILNLFQEQLNKFPQKTALRDDFSNYTYLKLDQLSNRVAAYLITFCGKEDQLPVAVLMQRSASMIAVLLGILKSGRPYIPLDPVFPKERLNHILNDSKSQILITENGIDLELEPLVNTKFLLLEEILSYNNIAEDIVDNPVNPEDTAYIIYTSGSTGNPKGVEVGHKSLLNFLCSIQQKPGINHTDVLLSVTTYSFDISILEFFAPFISGSTLYIVSQETLGDVELMIKKIEEIKPTVIQATPSFYQMLFHGGWKGDKKLKVLCGGDLLSQNLAKNLIENCSEVWNMYGPTETTIWSSLKQIQYPADSSNIGKPIHNTQFYILDEFLYPKPLGTPGAIFIGGDGLSKGYYYNEELTAKKFITSPFNKAQLLYETGDVGRWNNMGEIEFLGRNDNQVKIRGYRIEIGDIESKLNQIEGISEAVVIAKQNGDQEAFLAAYFLKEDVQIGKDKIIEELQKHLPYYMIPNAFVALETFPLTPNKKIDRKVLTNIEIVSNTTLQDFKPAVTDLHKRIADLWSTVLKIDAPIAINDNFFSLGGHSLNAVRLITLFSKNFSYSFTMKDIFKYPTIAAQALYIQTLNKSSNQKIIPSEVKDYYNLTPSQNNIWIASQKKKGSLSYNMSAAYKIEGNVDSQKIETSLAAIIQKYEILRTNFVEINGIPYQKINSFETLKFEIQVRKVEQDKLEEIVSGLANQEFDLERDLLLRAHYLISETGDSIFMCSTHHIVMDGLSLEILIRDFIEQYNQKDFYSSKNKTVLKFQYKDYSEWSNKSIQSTVVKNELFWKSYLENYQLKDLFKKDFYKENEQQKSGKYFFECSIETTLALKKIALKQETTLYNVLVAAFNILIYKLSAHTDICIATVNSGRDFPELQDEIGMFVKTIVLRTQIAPEQSFDEVLKNVQNNLLEIDNFHDLPLEKMPKQIFETMLAYQNPEFSFDNTIELSNSKLVKYPIQNQYSKIPMLFNLFENDHKLEGIVDYDRSLFDSDTIEIMTLKFQMILNEIVKDSSSQLDLINLHTKLEQDNMLEFDFNF